VRTRSSTSPPDRFLAGTCAHLGGTSLPTKMPRRTQQAIGAPAPRVFVPAGGGKASLQVVCNPGRLSRYASPAEAQQNKSLRLEVEVHSAPT